MDRPQRKPVEIIEIDPYRWALVSIPTGVLIALIWAISWLSRSHSSADGGSGLAIFVGVTIILLYPVFAFLQAVWFNFSAFIFKRGPIVTSRTVASPVSGRLGSKRYPMLNAASDKLDPAITDPSTIAPEPLDDDEDSEPPQTSPAP